MNHEHESSSRWSLEGDLDKDNYLAVLEQKHHRISLGPAQSTAIIVWNCRVLQGTLAIVLGLTRCYGSDRLPYFPVFYCVMYPFARCISSVCPNTSDASIYM